MTQLVEELSKQRASLKEDISTLIQESLVSLQTSVDTFQQWLAATESLAGDNFDKIFATKSVNFVSNVLMEITGNALFESAPVLERAHRVGKKLERTGQPPHPFVVCFHRYQEKERLLQWARQHTPTYRNATQRIYPEFSVSLSRRRAEFKDIKQALYGKGIKFQLLYPAILRVTYNGHTFKFNTPEEAKAFYDQQGEVWPDCGLVVHFCWKEASLLLMRLDDVSTHRLWIGTFCLFG